VKPSRFTYLAPTTLDEVARVLDEHGDDAKVLAGGQSLVPMLNLRLAAPEVLVDLNRVPGLDYIRLDGDALAIGAMTRHRTVVASPLVHERLPLLARAASVIGYPAIRNRGTFGGSVAHADPVAEMPCIALTLDAELVAHGPRGRRTIAARDFFVGYFTTALEPEEILVEVRLPLPAGAGGWGFNEFSRKSGDFALAAAAVDLRISDGVIGQARIGLAGVADRPVRAERAQALLLGRPATADDELLAQVSEAVLDGDISDPARAASNRRAGVIAARAVQEAITRCGEPR
jgi:carbon-monoxide dehydrogenase medium subunit